MHARTALTRRPPPAPSRAVDLLNEKKSFGSFATGAITLKATSTSGVKVTAASTGFEGDNTSVKFEYADVAAGVSLKNLTLYGAGKKSADLELAFSDLIPDATVGFKAGLTSASATDSVDVSVAYAKAKVAAGFSLSVLNAMSFAKKEAPAGANIASFDVMTDVNDFTLGGSLGLNAGDAGAVAPALNLLAGYKKDDLSVFAATSGLKKDELAVAFSAYYQYSSSLGAAAKLAKKTLEVGTTYALDADTKLVSKASFAKGASSVPFSFCLTQKLRPSVELSLPFQFEAAKGGAVSLKQFGFALAAGDL